MLRVTEFSHWNTSIINNIVSIASKNILKGSRKGEQSCMVHTVDAFMNLMPSMPVNVYTMKMGFQILQYATHSELTKDSAF